MIQTLLRVNELQKVGYKGFYHAAGELHPDCDVTPWLIYKWLSIFTIGFRRAHHILAVRFALWDMGAPEQGSAACIISYFSAIAADNAIPLANDVIAAVIWYGNRTKRHLFGISSSQRSVKKS
jgi:hypothetical protein